MRTIVLLLLLAFALAGCSDDETDGGPCEYAAYPGTCTGTGNGEFTYAGTVEGQQVTFGGNALYDGIELADGETTSCELSYITRGTCTPCELDIGACSSEAFAGQP